MPERLRGPFRILSNKPDLVNGPIHEIALYNFAMSAQQVAQDVKAKDAKPFSPEGNSVPRIIAQWAPGESRVYVAADTGIGLVPLRDAL